MVRFTYGESEESAACGLIDVIVPGRPPVDSDELLTCDASTLTATVQCKCRTEIVRDPPQCTDLLECVRLLRLLPGLHYETFGVNVMLSRVNTEPAKYLMCRCDRR